MEMMLYMAHCVQCVHGSGASRKNRGASPKTVAGSCELQTWVCLLRAKHTFERLPLKRLHGMPSLKIREQAFEQLCSSHIIFLTCRRTVRVVFSADGCTPPFLLPNSPWLL